MSQPMQHTLPHVAHHDHHDHGAAQESNKLLGFWIFLVTDCLLFASIFATYVLLRTHTDGGPTEHELFSIPVFLLETIILLTSSFTSGLATLAMRKGNKKALLGWLTVTALLGLAFVGMEVNEFVHMASEGATISRSASLTGFFTLVGTHGCHVSLGLLWMFGLMAQIKKRGINPISTRKVLVLSLYWHFLDVIWVFLYSVVYLMGVM
ncbi:MAG: cytochrome o ubiquinol oxidase subunit III [Tumebacillaceae bacterium]